MVSVYYAVLLWSVIVCLPVTAQSSLGHEFDPSPIPAGIAEMKPFPEVRWHRGVIHLKSQEQIKGYLYYEPERSLVLAYHRGRLHTFNILQVDEFYFFDQDLQYMRSYQSITKGSATVRQPRIYEVISLGHFSLLRKENNCNALYKKRLKQRNIPLEFDYFIWDGEQVWSYRYFQKKLLPTLCLRDQALEQFSFNNNAEDPTLLERHKMLNALNQWRQDLVKPEIKLAKIGY